MEQKCWKENIPLLKRICRDNGITDYKVVHLYTDPDGDEIYQFSADCQWPAKSWDYYQKHRVRKTGKLRISKRHIPLNHIK